MIEYNARTSAQHPYNKDEDIVRTLWRHKESYNKHI